MNKKKNITNKLFQEALNFHKNNNYEEAEIIYKKILKIESNHFESLLKIGTLYIQNTKLNEAKEFLKRAEKINSDNPDLLNNLGYLFILIKEYKTAINYFEKIIKINPNFEKAFLNLGILYNNQNKFQEAIEQFKKTISINPKNTDAYNKIGDILILLNKYNLAISYYKKSLEIKPNDEKILCKLGIALVFNETKNYQEAILCFEKAIKINPNYVDAYNSLGHIYHVTIGNIEKSIIFLQKAIQINPKYFKAYYNLGNLYREIGECENAKNFYNKALNINPNFIKSFSNLLICTCYSHKNKNYLEIAKKFENFLTKFEKKKFINFKISNKKSLKVGFLSADFRNHPVGYFLLDVIKNLKNKNIKLYAYSDHSTVDETTKILKKGFNNWLNVSKINDLDIINLIRNDKIDILVDLAGHTGNRLNVFKNRCSPKQITWCGWLASTGVKEIDYIIGDPYATPANDQYKFVEKIYPLNKIWCCLSTSNLIPEIKINKNNNNYITFGSFNRVSKINDKVISIWSKILKQIPKSKLVLKFNSYDKQYIRSNILKKFKVYGINDERIILEGKSPRLKSLEYYNKIDIVLDTFPYNGGTTSFEAAYMGVPIITMENNSFMFRCGESINKNLNMGNWIAKDDEDYIFKALKFSENKIYLANLKSELRNIALKSPLFNSENFSKGFYKMLLDIARK